MEPEIVADYACHCGEGPLWNPNDSKLYWTDIPLGRLYRYDPVLGGSELCFEGEALGGFTLQADGALLLFMARGSVKLWREGVFTTLIEEIPEERESRFNDVIADPEGRVFCGTMQGPAGPGRLYRLDRDLSLHVIATGIGCSNGLGFTPDRTKMYYIDTPTREITLFDYDRATGDVANRRLFAETEEGGGLPDGMTVDGAGCVWCAKWDGGELVRYSSEGVEMSRITFPARKISSATFAGPNYDTLYVTSAGGDNRAENGPGAGALFRVDVGVTGVAEFESRIGL